MNLVKHLTILTAAALLLIASGCSNSGSPEAASEPAAPGTIVINGDDTMRFDVTAFSVTTGEDVTILFKNIGKLPKEAMGHNLVVLQPGTDLAAFAMAAMTQKDNEYLPPEAEHQAKIIAATKVLGPGEQETITFTAGAPGEYPFICSFPGHFAIMQGVMTVTAQ